MSCPTGAIADENYNASDNIYRTGIGSFPPQNNIPEHEQSFSEDFPIDSSSFFRHLKNMVRSHQFAVVYPPNAMSSPVLNLSSSLVECPKCSKNAIV
ncbi:MAG TPA: hypothetical protein V6D02_12575, partial [Candidatus Obscuribacterales bacterium]